MPDVAVAGTAHDAETAQLPQSTNPVEVSSRQAGWFCGSDAEGVTEVYSVSGEWDLVAIVRVAQYDQIARVVTEIFPQVPGIQRTQTLTAFRAYSKKDLQQAWDIGVE